MPGFRAVIPRELSSLVTPLAPASYVAKLLSCPASRPTSHEKPGFTVCPPPHSALEVLYGLPTCMVQVHMEWNLTL